jgi:hypothetical protein
MSPAVALYFQQAEKSIQDHVVSLVSALESGTKPNVRLGVKGLYFGTSDKDVNDLFSLVSVDLTKMLDNVKLPDLSKALSSPSSSSEVSSSGLSPKIQGATFKVLPKKTIGLGAHVELALNFPVSAKIGTLEAGLSLDKEPFLKTGIDGITIGKGKNDLHVGAVLQFQENDQTPVKVALLADSALKGKAIESVVALNQMSLGFNSEDQVSPFRRGVYFQTYISSDSNLF